MLEVGSRRVHVLGVTRHPTGEWVTQQARNFMLALGEQADRFRFLVRDRDTKFTASCDAVFADVGITVLRRPPRAPKAFEAHNNAHRPHRALEQRSPIDSGRSQQPCSAGAVRRTQVLGGLINEYRQAA